MKSYRCLLLPHQDYLLKGEISFNLYTSWQGETFRNEQSFPKASFVSLQFISSSLSSSHQPSYLKEEKDKTREEHSFWCSNDCKSLLYYKEEQNESFTICNLKWYILYFSNFYFLRYITEIEYQNKMDFKLRSYFNAYFLH